MICDRNLGSQRESRSDCLSIIGIDKHSYDRVEFLTCLNKGTYPFLQINYFHLSASLLRTSACSAIILFLMVWNLTVGITLFSSFSDTLVLTFFVFDNLLDFIFKDSLKILMLVKQITTFRYFSIGFRI